MSSRRSESSWRALVRRVGNLLHSWWQGDRIRIAPAEGRLLGLQPPCLLLIANQPVQVCRRAVRGKRVIYFCRTIVGIGRLTIHPSGLEWRRRNQVERISETEIEVFPVT